MKSKRNKIAIIICDPIYIRNYLLTNAFKEIEKNNDIIFLIPEYLKSLVNDNRFKEYQIIIYKYSKFLRVIARFVNELSLFKGIGLSKDFYFRIRRKYNHSPHLNDGTLNARRLDHRIKVFIVKNFYQFLAKKDFLILFNELSRIIFSFYSPIQKFLISQNINVVICPCSAAGTEEFDIGACTASNSNKVKTILIIDNWDNISSKYIMPYLPSHTVVWGEQTRFHGITIQGINPSDITALGTPRFYCYSKEFNLKSSKNLVIPELPKKYILYLGSQTFYDENYVIEKLKEISNQFLDGFKIIYRPHPWREVFNKKIELVSGVIIDPTLQIDSDNFGSISLPKLDLYNHILSNATLVIGGCTSMLVEASLLRKPYLLLAHDDGNKIQSPFEIYKNKEHQSLSGILNNVTVCYSLDNLSKNISSLLKKNISINDPVLDYIISPKYSNFSFYLNKLIQEQIIK